MDYTTSKALLLDNSKRRITRQQTNKLKCTFPFLDLPAELRNVVYGFCLDNNINLKPYFDKYHAKLLVDKKGQMPVPKKVMYNTALLINKQINGEAQYLLDAMKKSVFFDHGIFTLKEMTYVVNTESLRRVTNLEISDAGHPIIRGKILPESWHGYMRLFRQVAAILAEGHNLKTFTIDFSDTRMSEHMTTCWHATYECGFRDQIVAATDELRKVRGVGCVTINGLNLEHAKELKTRMESKEVTFLTLPREVRDMIYFEAVDWNSINASLVSSLAKKGSSKRANNKKKKAFRNYPTRTTPTVLLINKKISSEASEVLHKKSLTLDFPSNHKLSIPDGVPYILDGFISLATLSNVKFLALSFGAWEWSYACLGKDFISVLASSPNLERLTIIFNDSHKNDILTVSESTYPDRQIHDLFSNLIMIRGLKSVEFQGDLPDCYTATFKQVMMSEAVVGESKPNFFVQMGDGSVLDIEETA